MKYNFRQLKDAVVLGRDVYLPQSLIKNFPTSCKQV